MKLVKKVNKSIFDCERYVFDSVEKGLAGVNILAFTLEGDTLENIVKEAKEYEHFLDYATFELYHQTFTGSFEECVSLSDLSNYEYIVKIGEDLKEVTELEDIMSVEDYINSFKEEDFVDCEDFWEGDDVNTRIIEVLDEVEIKEDYGHGSCNFVSLTDKEKTYDGVKVYNRYYEVFDEIDEEEEEFLMSLSKMKI